MVLALGESQRADAQSKPDTAWVLKKPGPETQVQKPASARGNVNPCLTPDPGFGNYEPWSRGITTGQFIAPKVFKSKAKGSFDVMFHFHGHEAARKEWVRAIDGAVLVGVDLGLGSGAYEQYFAKGSAFVELLASVERAVAKRMGVPSAKARHVGLSAWSAGYGAVGEILEQPAGKKLVDSVVLLDGLHSGYSTSGGTLNELQLAPFVWFAREAAARRRFFYVSHSSIIPPGYASTTETANYLISEVGGRPSPSGPRGTDPLGLDLLSWYVRGNFHVRGYAGNAPEDHCAQLALYRDVVRLYVARRWR